MKPNDMPYQTDLQDESEASLCDGVCIQEGCSSLLGEAHRALRATMEELAALAGLTTADIATNSSQQEDAQHSGYFLLLDSTSFHQR